MKKLGIFSSIIGITIVFFLLVTVLRTLAQTPNDSPSLLTAPTQVPPSTSLLPKPVDDPTRLQPISPLIDADNPASPYYNPDFKYGLPGTRFGPLGQQSKSLLTRSSSDGMN